MKLKNLIACFFLGFIMVSCIQDEAPNAEAAIDACKGSDDVVLTDINAEAKRISIYVYKTADITKQKLNFVLPQGATINPPSVIENDFTTPQKYTVTSEDGKWSAVYTVEFVKSELPTNYHFETLTESSANKYDIFYEFQEGTSTEPSKIVQWASGNIGYDLTGMAKESNDYPTVQVNDGKIGKCLKLETKNTGSFGAGVNMPIAAGNLFIGKFDVSNALADALRATQFGLPFYKVPQSLKGYYKFKAGDIFTENGKPVEGKKDQCDIYAIFYETDNNHEMLDGYNALTSPKLISVARIEDPKETDQWTEFNLPFIMRPGKTIDQAKLKAGKYKLSIVFSSSIEGDHFRGAVGSTLYIDEVELIFKEN